MSEKFRDNTEPVVIHRQTSPHYGLLDDDVYYPINHWQLRDLLGKVLTQLDAMGLPDRAHRAARSLLTQEVWRWWDGVHENATTSGAGSIAPVVTRGSNPNTGAVSNRWGWKSEAEYLGSLTASSTEATGHIAGVPATVVYNS